MNPKEILKRYWGYDDFRPMQLDIISSVLDGQDTLAVMPTGGGKSICFQVPGMAADGLTIVVSPLIALMKDQVYNLTKRGIKAASIHSGMKFNEVKRQFESLTNDHFKFLYVSPERLETSLFQEYLSFLHINLIAVDEAHCISQWGYDFRPSYLKIARLREHLPEIPILAVTASATPKVQQDIVSKLIFRKGHRSFILPFERQNLSYSVFMPPSKERKITEIFQKVPGSAIAYCRSRKRTRELSSLLAAHHIPSDFYHAGLSADERNEKQDAWTSDKIRIICSTNAFGMGIDKPDVRAVVHFDIPDALENYYQEAGRAGRDERKAYAVLLFHPHEVDGLKQQVSLKFPTIPEIRQVYSSVCSYLQLPAGKGRGQSFDFDLGRFIETYQLNPILAASALKILEQEENLILSENIFTPSTVEIFASRETLATIEKDFPKYTGIIKGLLRSYEGIFEHPSFIDEFTLARFIRMNKTEVIQYLTELDQMQIIEYRCRKDVPQIIFLNDRVPSADLIINEKNIAWRKAAHEERLAAMIEYATQSSECRSLFINRYFGGAPVLPCGICDVCLSKKYKPLTATELRTITSILRENNGAYLTELQLQTQLHKDKVAEAVKYLQAEGHIAITEDGKVVYK